MCCSTNAMEERSCFRDQSAISCSAHIIFPEFGWANRSNKRVRVVFPAPVEPTTPVVFPAFSVRDRLVNVLSRPE